jgi:hypothetical protein
MTPSTHAASLRARPPTSARSATPGIRPPARPEPPGHRVTESSEHRVTGCPTPPSTTSTERRSRRGLTRRVRRTVVPALALSLIVLSGGAAAASASTPLTGSPVTTQPAPAPPSPSAPAPPAPVLPIPPATPHPGASPDAVASPCTGPDCIPQPADLSGQPVDGGTTRAECGITSIGGCVTNAIDTFFRDLVTVALTPLLDLLLSANLLSTPSPASLPQVGQLWTQSWEILLAGYGLLVMVAGVLVMAYGSLQARYSIKEIAPRLVIGFLAGALNLFLATKAVEVANALVTGVMGVIGGGRAAGSVGEAMKNMILTPLSGGMFVLVLGVFLVVALVVLLITYLVRVALTLILIVAGPLAMMCHALPQTEPVAFWWWRAFGGCLAIPLAQSLALITGLRVFLTPGGFTPFGSVSSGLVTLLVALALLYILIKIPFWSSAPCASAAGTALWRARSPALT